jgi:3-oxoacyl-[acyl-carrier-protein] synthase-3
VGHYVPERVVTNADLEKIMDTTSEWIIERTGIEERHFAEIGKDTTAGMGVKAAKMAMERANVSADDIDLIVFATLSSDYFFPGPGVIVQRELGMKRTVAAIDVRAQCSGFVYGVSVADQYIKTGMYKTVLVIGSEIQSVSLDLTTRGRGTAVLFGDGAGAAIIQRTENSERGILSTHLHSQGEYAEKLYLKAPGTFSERFIYENIETDYESIYPHMEGNFVFKNAVVRFQEVIGEALTTNNYTAEDLDLFVPHQANLRITQFVQRQMKLPNEKVFSNIQKYGNTTAATIPIALSELWEQGRLNDGDLVVLAAFGSGFTWASAIMHW